MYLSAVNKIKMKKETVFILRRNTIKTSKQAQIFVNPKSQFLCHTFEKIWQIKKESSVHNISKVVETQKRNRNLLKLIISDMI